MGDEYVPQLRERQTGKHHLASDPVPAIDHIDLPACDDRLRRCRPIPPDTGPARSTEQDKARSSARWRRESADWEECRSERRQRISAIAQHGGNLRVHASTSRG
jgi:hypothetical protein